MVVARNVERSAVTIFDPALGDGRSVSGGWCDEIQSNKNTLGGKGKRFMNKFAHFVVSGFDYFTLYQAWVFQDKGNGNVEW